MQHMRDVKSSYSPSRTTPFSDSTNGLEPTRTTHRVQPRWGSLLCARLVADLSSVLSTATTTMFTFSWNETRTVERRKPPFRCSTRLGAIAGGKRFFHDCGKFSFVHLLSLSSGSWNIFRWKTLLVNENNSLGKWLKFIFRSRCDLRAKKKCLKRIFHSLKERLLNLLEKIRDFLILDEARTIFHCFVWWQSENFPRFFHFSAKTSRIYAKRGDRDVHESLDSCDK